MFYFCFVVLFVFVNIGQNRFSHKQCAWLIEKAAVVEPVDRKFDVVEFNCHDSMDVIRCRKVNARSKN